MPNKYREQIHDGEAQGMKESEQKAAAKAFAAHWQGKGYEKGEEPQQGRAEYGKRILAELSAYLTDRFGKGYSAENLKLMR